MKKMITRRNFLKAAGVSAAALGLAACGGSGSSTAATSSASVSMTRLPSARSAPRRFRCGIGRCFRLDLGAQGHAGLPLGRRRRC